MKIAYENKNLSQAKLDVIEIANDIIDEYRAEGLTLTLRQLYYQFVARDLLPNEQKEYKRLGNILNDGRLNGLVHWEAIEDRTRSLTKWQSYASPRQAVHRMLNDYSEDLWEGQSTYMEVWVEKEALAGVVHDICSKHDMQVPYFSCRGYASASEMWKAGQRLRQKIDEEGFEEVIILHLGDHDPSGIDMTSDITSRLQTFSDFASIWVNRIALNMDQVEEYNPPPNPAKLTDTRSTAYIKEYGSSSWELDALDPSTIRELIRDHVEMNRDEEIWEDRVVQEQANKNKLRNMMENL